MSAVLAPKELNPALDHLIGRLHDAEVKPLPFPHVYVTRCFPVEYYDEILENLPEDTAYQDRTYENRAMVSTKDLQTLFWKDLSEWMTSYESIGAVMDMFNITERNIAVDVRLVRDKTGYAIKPHTDVRRKLISLLFYLPESVSDADAGTSIMVPKNRDFTSDGNARYDFENFLIVKTAPFMPNTMLGFPRSDISFHGVMPTSVAIRNVLLLNLYKVK